MRSAFLGFDLIRRNAGLELKCNARGFIHPELNDGEEAIGFVVGEEKLIERRRVKLRRRRRGASG
jgi:hypothetical protein